MVFDVLFLVKLVIITVGCGTLGGKGVVMVLFPCQESASEDFLNRLLVLFCHPSGSAAALLAGVLPLRYCSSRLACRFPTWKLLDKGDVCELVTDGVVDDRVLGRDSVCRVSLPGSACGTGVLCDGRVLGAFKKNSTQQKNTSTPCKTW